MNPGGQAVCRTGITTLKFLPPDAEVGIEFKRADNFVLFGETSFPQTEVDVVQLRGEWQTNGPLWSGRAELRADLVASPGELTGKNGHQEFDALRPGAARPRLGARRRRRRESPRRSPVFVLGGTLGHLEKGFDLHSCIHSCMHES